MGVPTNGQKDAAGNIYVPGAGFIKNLQWDANGAGRGTMANGMEWSSGPGLQSMLSAGASTTQSNTPAPMPTPAPAASAAAPTPPPAAAAAQPPAAMTAAPVLQPPPPPGPGWAPAAPGALNPNLGKRAPRESINALAGMGARGAY